MNDRNIRVGFTYGLPFGDFANAFGNRFEVNVSYTMMTRKKVKPAQPEGGEPESGGIEEGN